MWHSVFNLLPDNGATVWVRVLDIYGQIGLATYNTDTKEFTTINTEIIIPAVMVGRWKES